MAKLKANLLANYIGQIWVALMGMAFIPMYIKFIGIESFGLIGIFGVLSAWFVLLDMGITTALAREIALFTGGAHSPHSIRQFLRSVELVSFLTAGLIFVSTYYAANWLATSWLKVSGIPLETVELAFQVMGLVAAFRFIEGVYRSCVLGLQRHVLYNAVNSFLATVRGVGAVGVLACLSPTIHAFFYWQAAVSILTTVALGVITYRTLPSTGERVVFTTQPLLKIWKFAGGMFSITLLSLLLTQVDKIILSNLISLSEYGHYTLAAMVSGMLYMLITPITQTWYPKFVQYYAGNMHAELADSFHQSAQMVVAVSGVAALTGAFFSEELIFLWTGNINLAKTVSPVLTILFTGNLLNTLMYIPYQMQVAHGVTKIAVYGNLVAVIFIVPAIYLIVPVYGVTSAAGIWAFLNGAYVVFGASYMFRTLLKAEKSKWFLYDVTIPLLSCSLPLFIGRYLIDSGYSGSHEILVVFASASLSAVSTVVAAPKLRLTLIAAIRNYVVARRSIVGEQN